MICSVVLYPQNYEQSFCIIIKSKNVHLPQPMCITQPKPNNAYIHMLM